MSLKNECQRMTIIYVHARIGTRFAICCLVPILLHIASVLALLGLPQCWQCKTQQYRSITHQKSVVVNNVTTRSRNKTTNRSHTLCRLYGYSESIPQFPLIFHDFMTSVSVKRILTLCHHRQLIQGNSIIKYAEEMFWLAWYQFAYIQSTHPWDIWHGYL